MTEEKGILLQSGTNELEIVTFTVGENLFCINVLKVKEIIHPLEVTPVPDSNPAIEGVSQVRGEIMPVVNLARVMKLPEIEPENTKFIITELNQMKIVFRVDEVHRIQRISWEQIEEPEKLSIGLEELAVGIVKLDGNLVLLLDYEKIIYEISGNADFAVTGEDRMARKVNREEKTILLPRTHKCCANCLKIRFMRPVIQICSSLQMVAKHKSIFSNCSKNKKNKRLKMLTY